MIDLLFKDKLKKYRTENKISQEELANKLYVSRTLISKWENGVIYPSVNNMEKLAALMMVDINYLLSDEETRTLALNSNKEISLTKRILYIISLILVSVGITLLIVGFIFPQDLIRPNDIYNSVNTITVICFTIKILGSIFFSIGIILALVCFNITVLEGNALIF